MNTTIRRRLKLSGSSRLQQRFPDGPSSTARVATVSEDFPAPADMRCQPLDRAARVDARHARLSWTVPPGGARVVAFHQLQIATHASAFADGAPLAWDSGMVGGGHSSAAVPPFVLLDDTAYCWRVRVFDDRGGVSAWSAVQRMTTSTGTTPPVAALVGTPASYTLELAEAER